MSVVFNPFTGNLDIKGSGGTSSPSADNFSYTLIDIGETVIIPENQEMVHVQDLMVRGDLIVRGSTFQIVDETASNGLSWSTIPANKNVNVPVNRVMFYFSPLIVQGNLIVDGILKEVA